MATVAMKRKVASNPHTEGKEKGKMTAAAKKAFVERMAKARKKAAKPGTKNPSSASNKSKSKPAGRKPSHSKKGTRNPNILADPKGLAINIVTALLSAVATRQIPQMLLAEKNTGYWGYLANAGAGIAATFAASEFISAAAAQAAAVGSGVIILDRVLTEKFSPIGAYLSLTGLGDATAATQLGTVADGYYIHPTIFLANGQPLIPHQITDAAVAAFQALPAAAPGAPAPRQLATAGATPAARSRYNRW